MKDYIKRAQNAYNERNKAMNIVRISVRIPESDRAELLEIAAEMRRRVKK